jgi:hypothetical protein
LKSDFIGRTIGDASQIKEKLEAEKAERQKAGTMVRNPLEEEDPIEALMREQARKKQETQQKTEVKTEAEAQFDTMF